VVSENVGCTYPLRPTVSFKLVVLIVELLLFLNISSGLTIVTYVGVAYSSACMVSATTTRVVGRLALSQ
jgi:hypothetical protein